MVKHDLKVQNLIVKNLVSGDLQKIFSEAVLAYMEPHILDDLDLVYAGWVKEQINQFQEALTFVGEFDSFDDLLAVPVEDIPVGGYAIVKYQEEVEGEMVDKYAVYFWVSGISQWVEVAGNIGGGSGLDITQGQREALVGNGGAPSSSNTYVTQEGLNLILSELDLETGARVLAFQLILESDTLGTVNAQWINFNDQERTAVNASAVFIGATSTGNFRWDKVLLNNDGTVSVLTGTEGAEAIEPTNIPAGALVGGDVIWNEFGEGQLVVNNYYFGLKRYITTPKANTTNQYAKIWEGALSNQDNYQFVIAYGVPASAGKQRGGVLNVTFKCQNNQTIQADTVKLETVDGDSTAGDFVLVQLDEGRGALYHRSHQFWARIQFTVPFHNTSVREQDFTINANYGGLPSGNNWPSVKYTGGQTREQIRDLLSSFEDPNQRLDASAIKNLPTGGAGGGLELVDPFTPILKFDKNYKSKINQTSPINFTLDSNESLFFNRYEVAITANGTSGKPTFTSDFIIQYDDWSNNTGDVNQLIFKFSPSGKVWVWLDNVEKS
jgi:hypothetical protein